MQLSGSDAPRNSTKVMLRMSADGFTPNITGDFGGLASGLPPGPGASLPPEITTVGNKIISAFSNLAPISLMASEEKTFKASLSLPNDGSVVPGSVIMTRAEYWYDGVLAAYGPPATTYIAHPLPPSNGGLKDVLIFCHQGFLPNDFTMLESFFKVRDYANDAHTRQHTHTHSEALIHASMHTQHTGIHTLSHTHTCKSRYSECAQHFWIMPTTPLLLKAKTC